MGSKLVFGVRKLIPKRQEDLAGYDLVSLTFDEAYAELRRACPRGDLRIHLSVEADTAEEVGAVFEDAHRIEWECGCVTVGRSWDPSECTGGTHGCASGTSCTQSPLDHSAYQDRSVTKAR